MIKPITCNNCRKALAWFESTTGCVRDERLPKHIKVFGAYLICEVCDISVKFDGLAMRKRGRELAFV